MGRFPLIGSCRRRRKPQELRLPGRRASTTIARGWLANFAPEDYRRALWYALHIALAEVAIDALPAHATEDQRRAADQRLEALLNGNGRVPKVPRLAWIKQYMREPKEASSEYRHLFVKPGGRFFGWQKRGFAIEGGYLKVYKSADKTAPLQREHSLAGAACKVELARGQPTMDPPFEQGYDCRLRLTLLEGVTGCVLLYAPTTRMAENWQLKIKFARRTQTMGKDAGALRTCIRRIGMTARRRGWDALFETCAHVAMVKRGIKLLAAHAYELDAGRGWFKLRDVYAARTLAQGSRQEQARWLGARLAQALEKASLRRPVPSMGERRAAMVDAVSAAFRRFRGEGVPWRTPVQIARVGLSFGIAYDALGVRKALRLALPNAAEAYASLPKEALKVSSAEYSDRGVYASSAKVRLSDCLTKLLFSDEAEGADLPQQQVAWPHFVKISQISSVVLHSARVAPVLGGSLATTPVGVQGGCWFTLHGPRVCWARQLRPAPFFDAGAGARGAGELTAADRSTVHGAADGIEVADALLRGVPGSSSVRRLWVSVMLKEARLPSPSQEQPLSEAFLVVHLFGRRFETTTERPDYSQEARYNVAFDVDVLAPGSNDAFSALDDCELCVDVVDARTEEVVWGARVALWRLLATGDRLPAPNDLRRSLSESLRVAPRRASWRLPLAQPGTPEPTLEAGAAFLAVEVGAELETPERPRKGTSFGTSASCVAAAALAASPSISPALLGRGPATSHYTVHRGAWFDPRSGFGLFEDDAAACFVELKLGVLRLPASDGVNSVEREPSVYYVEVACAGTTAASPARVRPMRSWARIRPTSTQEVPLDGPPVLLALPPGFWSKAQKDVSISVFRRSPASGRTEFADFKEFVDTLNAPQYQESTFTLERKYHAVLDLSDWAADQVIYNAKVAMATPPALVPSVRATDLGNVRPVRSDMAELGLSCLALRGREHATAAAAVGASGGGPLCVGDQVLLEIEEESCYPASRAEFIASLAPGSWRAAPPSSEVGRLREPMLAHECEDSGLQGAPDRPPLRPRSIPAFCMDDLTPHRFALPMNERDFRERHLPGVYWRVMTASASVGAAAEAPLPARSTGVAASGRQLGDPIVVNSLSHLVTRAACKLLAAHADRTCDLELGQKFLDGWQQRPWRRLSLPGITDAGAERVLLRGVPLERVEAMHPSGFNLFDASLVDASEVVRLRPPPPPFHPRFDHRDDPDRRISPAEWARRGGLGGDRLVAGPLPADASDSVCQYEWSLRLFAPKEGLMYDFVRLLQHCARREGLQRKQRAQAIFSKVSHLEALAVDHGARHAPDAAVASARLAADTAEEAAAAAAWGRRPPGSGRLEVVLVEARRLRHRRAGVGADRLDQMLAGPSSGIDLSEVLSPEPEVNVVVRFRMLRDGEPLAIRGEAEQVSPAALGTDSPDWSSLDALRPSGGWTFRSAVFVPERMPSLTLEVEVCHQSFSQQFTIGSIVVPVTKGKFLTDAKNPFRDLWLPLTSQAPDGRRVLNATGEVHLMTMWIPEGVEEASASVSARAHFLATLRPALRVWPPVLRELGYGTAAPLGRYNPNLSAGTTWPRSWAEDLEARASKVASSGVYLDCAEQRQRHVWAAWLARRGLGSLNGVRVGEMRLAWLHKEADARSAQELNEVVQAGIPGTWRARLWPDLILASRLQAGRSSQEYAALVQRGDRMCSCALSQLREDVTSAWSWEPSASPADRSLHTQRLRRARNVCTALIVLSMESACQGLLHWRDGLDGAALAVSGQPVAYCHSLLVVAFYMLLPQSSDGTGAMSEACVFWLLYTLIGSRTNGAFRDYFVASPDAGRPYNPLAPLAVARRSGAMEDIYLLDCALAVHEPDVWVRLKALGFQLPSVFFEAFSQLFARTMPTGSLFRFWDLLLSESSNPVAFPHARHPLVDLAFALLRSLRGSLLAAESAGEVGDHIVTALANLHDPETVAALTAEGRDALWNGLSRKEVLRLWRQGTQAYERFYEQFALQNVLLQELAHTRSVGAGTAGPRGVTTASLARQVLPALKAALAAGGASSADREDAGASGIFRPVPADALEVGPSLGGAGAVGQALRQLGPGGSVAAIATGCEPMKAATAVSLQLSASVAECPPRSQRPPAIADEAALREAFARRVPGWADRAEQIHQAFHQGPSAPMSFNDFAIGLICCSHGSVAEKAAALFDLYAFDDAAVECQRGLLHGSGPAHLIRVLAQREVDRLHGSHEREPLPSRSRFECANTPPQLCNGRRVALQLIVRVFCGAARAVVVGEAVVPSLRPFVASEADPPHAIRLALWAAPPSAADAPAPICVGELVIALQWLPKSPHDLTSGILRLHPRSVNLFPLPALPAGERPQRLEVLAAMPRGILRGGQVAPSPLAEFAFVAPTSAGPASADAEGGGVGEWRWVFGAGEVVDRILEEGAEATIRVARDLLEGGHPQAAGSGRALSLPGARLLVEAVLRRGGHMFTNREASIFADAALGASWAVPGISEAVLAAIDEVPDGCTARLLRDICDREGLACADVTRQVLWECERQAAMTGSGGISLRLAGQSLRGMFIKDISPGKRKILCIRYLRAGSGDRRNAICPVSTAGTFEPRIAGGGDDPSAVDLERASGAPSDGVAISAISREEFVLAVLRSALLSETLRSLSPATADGIAQAPLALDVTITQAPEFGEDHGESAGAPSVVFEAVLLEVWACDRIRGDKFLGEAWLPPLERFAAAASSRRAHDLALPLRFEHASGESGGTRPDPRKWQDRFSNEATLFLTAEWSSGAVPTATAGGGFEVDGCRIAGELRLRIHRAEGLRGTGLGDGGAYVAGHARNPVARTWRSANIAGSASAPQPLFRTLPRPPQRSTPVHGNDSIGSSGRAAGLSFVEWDQNVAATMLAMPVPMAAPPLAPPPPPSSLWGPELPVLFGGDGAATGANGQESARDEGVGPGPHEYGGGHGVEESARDEGVGPGPHEYGGGHGVEVWLTDTIAEFVGKLSEACGHLARAWAALHGDEAENLVLRYREAASECHSWSVGGGVSGVAVFAYAPRGDVSTDSLVASHNDLSNWLPLDPACTFADYASRIGFGAGVDGGAAAGQRFLPLLRVVPRPSTAILRRSPALRTLLQEVEASLDALEGVDEPDRCFGHSRLVHRHDGGSIEWRPCLAMRLPDAAARTRGSADFGLKWLVPAPGRANGRSVELVCAAAGFLLRPTEPQILG